MGQIYNFMRTNRYGRVMSSAGSAVHWIGGPLATILLTSFVIYLALSFAPGDPVAQILGSRSTPQQRAELAEQLGLNQPVLVRYWHWLTGALVGDFGLSTVFRQSVASIVQPRIITTLFLVVYSAVIIVVVGVALGSVGGVSRRLRPLISGLIGFGIAVPNYVAALVLVGIFAVQLRWFPTFGAGSGLADRIWHLTLPAISLAIGWTAYVAQISAAAIREESGREFVMTARARGLPPALIFRKHIMKNAAIPIITASGLSVAGLVAGAVVVETAFAVDGIGSLLVKSVSAKDYDVVVAISVLIVTVFVVMNTFIELAHSLIDPLRRKAGAR
jgi:peptide/nickel transport system permease protein